MNERPSERVNREAAGIQALRKRSVCCGERDTAAAAETQPQGEGRDAPVAAVEGLRASRRRGVCALLPLADLLALSVKLGVFAPVDRVAPLLLSLPNLLLLLLLQPGVGRLGGFAPPLVAHGFVFDGRGAARGAGSGVGRGHEAAPGPEHALGRGGGGGRGSVRTILEFQRGNSGANRGTIEPNGVRCAYQGRLGSA